MEDDYTGGDICIDGSTDCIGNDIVYGSRTDIHLKKLKPRSEWSGLSFWETGRQGVRRSLLPPPPKRKGDSIYIRV